MPASISAARLRARSATTSVKALTVGSLVSMRVSAASIDGGGLDLAAHHGAGDLGRGRLLGQRIGHGRNTGAGRELVVELDLEQRLGDRSERS